VSFRGEEQLGQVNVSSGSPDHEQIIEELFPARDPSSKGVLRKSVSLFRTVTGM
jgi:hypothetical protein